MVTPEMSHTEINHRILDGCFLGLRERKMFWSSEDIVKASFQYAESRQKITYGVNLNKNLKKNL